MKSLHQILAASLLPISIAVFASVPETRIISGTPVSNGSEISNSMAMIRSPAGTCSAIVISPRHLLTAGHCVDGTPDASEFTVFLGASKVAGPGVLRYRRHAGYGWQGDYLHGDVTVMRLSSAMTRMVPAVVSNEGLRGGETLTVAGYGYSEQERLRLGTLLKSTFTFGSNAQLATVFSDGGRVLSLLGQRNLCNGDSGGATFVRQNGKLRVLGVHSTADCQSRGYDNYVPDLSSWIRSQLSL